MFIFLEENCCTIKVGDPPGVTLKTGKKSADIKATV